jgi:AGCS family alanine or glycine:cation symporter
MLLNFLQVLDQANEVFLSYVALFAISSLGGYFTIKTGFFQIKNLPRIFKMFLSFLTHSQKSDRGTHPLKAFFASVGGMIGIGNVVAITTAVTIGGPGALLWVWAAACVGSLVKYSEIYLGHRYRVVNSKGSYDGGPMYFLQQAYSWKWLPALVSVLLCVYGTEIYQFSVIVHSVSTNFEVAREPVIIGLLALVLYSAVGGVERVGKICGILMPFFTSAYILMCLWVIIQNHSQIIPVLLTVFESAFSGHAAVGGFLGSTILMGLQQGVARAAYSADIGIGYDSIIQSESNVKDPAQQARLSILGVMIDNIVCTSSILVVLVTDVWKAVDPIPGSQLVQTALGMYFPGMAIFMPIFLFILGYTTVIAYFCVCLKCSRFLGPKYGNAIYVALAIPTFVMFSYYDQSQALLVMSVAQSLLLMVNLSGIWRLRGNIEFKA